MNNIFKNNELKFYMYGALLLISLFYVYYFSTRFSTVITVKKDFVKSQGRYSSNMIGTESGEVYKVSYNFLVGAFKSSEILNQMDAGKTFKISGYGKRVPMLGLYPAIVSAQEI